MLNGQVKAIMQNVLQVSIVQNNIFSCSYVLVMELQVFDKEYMYIYFINCVTYDRSLTFCWCKIHPAHLQMSNLSSFLGGGRWEPAEMKIFNFEK